MTQPVEATYPWPEDEMIVRYGLRRLTPEEQQVFAGLRLALDVFKVRFIKPPAAVPRARTGWIVWVAETYPGQHHIRLPGGATLLAPYHDITWERVPVETPATTIEDIRAEGLSRAQSREKRLQAEARKWRPGQVVTTPGTRLSWDSLTGWIDAWERLQRRAHSSDRYWKESQHIQALPVEMIAAEVDEIILYDFLDLMNSGDARPPKGMRAEHPTTPLVVEAHNRLVQLGAIPYRQQQSLRRVLVNTGSETTRKRPFGEEAAPHLSLF